MFKELWYLIKLLFSDITNQKAEVVKMKHFPFQGYSAMSWCGKVITRKDNVSDKVLNHERIHLEQAIELAKLEKTNTWLTYYWQYLKYWIKGGPIMAPASAAYYTIPFEMEAYGNEHNFDYKVTANSWKKYEIENRKETYNEYRYNWRNYCKNLI